jgi:Tfp pilus assembly protein PilX
MFRINLKQNSKGVSVFFALLILSVLLSIALGMSTILIGQARMLKGMEDSVVSFFTAESGVERMLYEDKMCRQPDCGGLPWSCLDVVNCDEGRRGGVVSGNLGDATYEITVNDGATVISSLGIYKGTRRAIETER